MVRKYKHHGHPFQKWVNTTMYKHDITPEVLAALAGVTSSAVIEWRRGGAFPKIIPFWALCRAVAAMENTSPEQVANNVLPYFNKNTRDPTKPIWMKQCLK